MSFLLFRNAHDLHQLKKSVAPFRDVLTTKVQYISTIQIIYFHAPERLHAARAFLRLYGASGQLGPKFSSGAAHRRLCFGYSSIPNTETEVHNEGKQKSLHLQRKSKIPKKVADILCIICK